MKRVSNIFDKKELENKIYKCIFNEINIKVDDLYKNIPHDLIKWINPKLKFWMRFLAIFTFFISLYYLNKKLSNINKYFVSRIDKADIYKKGFSKLKELKFESIEKVDNVKELFENRVPSIPSDATIIESSDVINFKVNGKYEAYIQTGIAEWKREKESEEGKKKEIETFNENTGYLIVKTNELMRDFAYTLINKNIFFAKKIKLENTLFNKAFTLTSNNPLSIRLLYTPLCMEETLKYHRNINKLSYWKVSKNDNCIKIIFRPKHIYKISINSKNKQPKDKEMIKENLANNIVDNIVMLYTIIYVVLIPPML